MKKSFREAKEIESLDIPETGMLTKGIRVNHPVFGEGVVVALFEFPPYVPQRHCVGIEFSSVGYKPLSPQYAKLSLIENK